jgi:hypothetical protein|tara:strand:+ start:4035 stop:4268 length:234 start_codon:yes stop_codon:yes gene_type:complete
MLDWIKIKEAMDIAVVRVTFTKADGDIRVMECTLAEYLLPKTLLPRPENLEVCIVYDLDADAWRSFRYDRVITVEVL